MTPAKTARPQKRLAKKTKSPKKPTKPKAKAKAPNAPTCKTRRKARGESRAPTIYIGIGGWTFEPWRGVFYPKGLPHAKELGYASERLTSIEVNGTFYRSQTPATFRKWASEVPDGFVFALKGPRFATNRRVLKEAGDSIKRFLDSGVTELGEHLGPLLWQFAPTKKFDAADFGGFLELLPHQYNGHAIRHVIEVRHDSFSTPEFTSLLRHIQNAGRVHRPCQISEHRRYHRRLRLCAPATRQRHDRDGLSARDIDAWAGRLQAWATGGAPDDLPLVEPPQKTKAAAEAGRATYSPTSSTKAKCARPRARWH